jgi:hypothetical protein
MSYLAEPTSKTGYGVVQVGDFIEVSEAGIVSLLQDVGPTADVLFNSVDADDITVGGSNVVTSVTPTAGYGIDITNLQSSGYDVTFDVVNTGVVELVAGPGISLSASAGSVTVSSYGADLINVYGTTTSYTATLNDEYIGVSSASAVTITLPTGVPGRVYTIKDEYGQGSGKITIAPQTGELIDGKVTYVIGVPYQSINAVFRAGKWWII